MCFTQGISLALSGAAFAMGGAIIHRGLPKQTGIGIIIIGLMELLQFFQHFVVATPEDDYSMCSSGINQFLTDVGYFHYAFQPLAMQYIGLGLERRTNLKVRYQGDMMIKLSWVFAAWTIFRYVLTVLKPDSIPNRGEDCPNYEWFNAGYDIGTGEMSPNLPGHSCTFIPKTSTGHLSWAIPLAQETYFVPHSATIHAFLSLSGFLHKPVLSIFAAFIWITGPILAVYITPSIMEQPAIWCFFSVTQCFCFPVMYYIAGDKPKNEETVVHEGLFGEKPLVYRLDQSIKNGTMNGKGKTH